MFFDSSWKIEFHCLLRIATILVKSLLHVTKLSA